MVPNFAAFIYQGFRVARNNTFIHRQFALAAGQRSNHDVPLTISNYYSAGGFDCLDPEEHRFLHLDGFVKAQEYGVPHKNLSQEQFGKAFDKQVSWLRKLNNIDFLYSRDETGNSLTPEEMLSYLKSQADLNARRDDEIKSSSSYRASLLYFSRNS